MFKLTVMALTGDPEGGLVEFSSLGIFKTIKIMKRLTLFFSLAALISCSCLPQLPIQTIYAGPGCEAPIPNYLEWITVRDNCEGYTLTQFPLPGTMLTADNPYEEIVIMAKDLSGNVDVERFDVVLIDTIPPELVIDSSFLSDLDSIIPGDPIYGSMYLMAVGSPGHYSGAFISKGMTVATLTKSHLEELGMYDRADTQLISLPMPYTIDAGASGGEWVKGGNPNYRYIPRNGLEDMYISEMTGDFSYRIPTGPGRYQVELHFAEIAVSSPGSRVFDVKAEDTWILDGFDIFQEAGADSPLIKTYSITVSDQWLDIRFISKKYKAQVSGMVIRRT